MSGDYSLDVRAQRIIRYSQVVVGCDGGFVVGTVAPGGSGKFDSGQSVPMGRDGQSKLLPELEVK